MTPGTAEHAVARTLQRIRDERLVMVVRSDTAEDAERAIDAAIEGGIRIVEITYSVPGTLELIKRVSARYGDEVCVGAGTVMTAAQVEDAAEAGASYVVSPAMDPDTIRAALRRGVLPLPGIMTPTEAMQATAAGAPAVKLFPARNLGPAFVKDLLAPMPDLQIVPSGGIDVNNVGEWFDSGVIAVGIGGNLSPARVADGEELNITARAAKLVAAVRNYPDNPGSKRGTP